MQAIAGFALILIGILLVVSSPPLTSKPNTESVKPGDTFASINEGPKSGIAFVAIYKVLAVDPDGKHCTVSARTVSTNGMFQSFNWITEFDFLRYCQRIPPGPEPLTVTFGESKTENEPEPSQPDHK